MGEDDVDDEIDDGEDNDEDEDIEGLPEFSMEDLNRKNNKKTGPTQEIVIDERTISDLAQVVTVANRDNRGISIEECVVNKAQISRIDVSMTVDDSSFAGNFDCRKGEFNGTLHFFEVYFNKDVDFGGAIFKKAIDFEDCQFQNGVNFAGATFEKAMSFTSCDFEGETFFDHATFVGAVDLNWSTFRKKAGFKEAHFSQAVDFSKVDFQEGLEKTGSNLNDMEKQAHSDKTSDPKKVRLRRPPQKKSDFNLWRELDEKSKKKVSRRDLLRGIYNLLPRKDKFEE